MAPQFIALTALPGNRGPIFRAWWQWTTICDSIPLGSNNLIWPPKSPGTHMMHRYTWGQNINNNKFSNQKKLLYLFVSVLNHFEDPRWCLSKFLITYCFYKVLVGLFKSRKLKHTEEKERPSEDNIFKIMAVKPDKTIFIIIFSPNSYLLTS